MAHVKLTKTGKILLSLVLAAVLLVFGWLIRKYNLLEHEIQARLTAETAQLSELLREQDNLDFLPIYEELLYYNIKLDCCLRHNISFQLPQELPVKDSFLAPDDPLALETKTRFSQENIEALEDILYTNAKTHIYMQRGLI